MGIVFNEDCLSFKLDTDNTSYVIAVADEEKFIGHCYYGAKVSDTDLTYMLRTAESPFVPSKNARERGSFFDFFPNEYPGNGLGDYREGAIEVIAANRSRAVNFTYKGYKIYAGKKALPGLPAAFGGENECQSLEIYAEDSALGLEATLVYSVFEKEDVITRSVSVTNRADTPIHLTKVMSASVDMDDEDYQMISLHGSWARERQIEYRPIAYGRQNAASFKGESSHQEHPFIAIASKDITQEHGKVYAFHFVYSGNFLAQAEKGQFDTVRVLMGIHPYGFDWKLDKDECFTAPEVVMTFSDTGLGTMTRNLHDLYRNHLIRSPYKDRKRPILINNWEATYFDFNTEKLLDIAREAKKCGIEMLVMDDGWFGHRSDDSTSLGDWKVNEEKLPGGLPYLVSEVNKIGLKFGIWFEPEMISPESDLYRQHPEWAISIPEREPTRSRNQLVLDLSNPEVVEYVYEAVASVLRSANIEYVKWDMNRQLTDLHSNYLPDDRQGELYHRYVLAVYELQGRLTTEFPELLLENCSGGGARFDPGMLYYSPQIWCSDDTDAIERLKIQEGTALIYPLSAMGAHVSDCPNHTVGRVTPFETRGNVALCGTFGYELDITRIPESDREQIPAQVALYHKYNDLVRNGDYYRIASYAENKIYDCYEVVAKDKSEALITYVSVLNRPNFHSRRICIPGLDETKRYRVEGTEDVFYGDTLMNAGLIIPNLWGDFQSKLIHLVEEG